MALSIHYQPEKTEQQWYSHWKSSGYFRSVPDERVPYAIVIPPPNVTGVLHMGHTLNETVQDVLIRRARMNGFNACWVPGSDHASIATEARVVAMLKEKGLDKSSMTREQFLSHAYEWREKYGNIIYSQIERLGCSCDWDRVNFTMDDHYYQAVIRTFVKLYEKDLIYRGARMIHWDPSAKTALSDEEVEYREVHSVLYYVRYRLEDPPDPSQPWITIATTRPETILGDTAIAVHPQDHRYQDLEGRYAQVPLIGRRIPILFDPYVDREFGTGCLKITPAHDLNDYNLGLKHHLPVVDVLNPDGTMSEAAGRYVGEDRFQARRKIVDDLNSLGLLVRKEEIQNKLGYSQRTEAVVEPRISTQWFLRMQEMAGPALDAVMLGDIRIHPSDRFINAYKNWLVDIQDWCLSRQLWWGQQIPAWFDASGNFVVAEDEEAARQSYRKKFPGSDSPLTRDPDVLDTWFSSWIWPIEVFRGITEPANPDFAYYYPTQVLVTGHDIIFFWVARMIMAGFEFENQKPFSDVYFTGMVRDKQGRKMSKSLGNSPDLLDLISRFGADSVRFGILISSPAGNDLLFDEDSCNQGRLFCNKMWNALKLLRKWGDSPFEGGNEAIPKDLFAVLWFEARLREASLQVQTQFDGFRISEALKTLYRLIWDDFCSWYLEWIKPARDQSMDAYTLEAVFGHFESLLQLLHPFMPFLTEELYHQLRPRGMGDDLMVRQSLPGLTEPDRDLLEEGELAKSFITAVRDARKNNGIPAREEIRLGVMTSRREVYQRMSSVLIRQCGSISLEFTAKPVPDSIPFLCGKDNGFLIATTEKGLPDPGQQAEKLRKELQYLRGFLETVDQKLSNPLFLEKARPDLIARERQKKSDTEEKIRSLNESLKHIQPST
ncbi:MAG TPA: valine--tRNA ligase [Chitinophagaceae bacterium]|nr:valine--tRNA ligase [Chitinophagaceae bacterium]